MTWCLGLVWSACACRVPCLPKLVVLHKCPGTDRDTVRTRVVAVLKDRCTGCNQIRVAANGTRVKKCDTIGCNRSILHPSLAAEASAI